MAYLTMLYVFESVRFMTDN